MPPGPPKPPYASLPRSSLALQPRGHVLFRVRDGVRTGLPPPSLQYAPLEDSMAEKVLRMILKSCHRDQVSI